MAANAIGTTVLFPVTPMTVAPVVAASGNATPAAAPAQGPKFDRASFGEAPTKGRRAAAGALRLADRAPGPRRALDVLGDRSRRAGSQPAHEGRRRKQGGDDGGEGGRGRRHIFLSEKMWRRGNRAGALATMLVVNSVTAMVVAHNYRVASSLR